MWRKNKTVQTFYAERNFSITELMFSLGLSCLINISNMNTKIQLQCDNIRHLVVM